MQREDFATMMVMEMDWLMRQREDVDKLNKAI